MIRIKQLRFLLIMMILMSGCQVDQKQTMGANSNRSQGFSGYGVDNVRQMEGPLSDMMIPDQAPSGLTDAARYLDKTGTSINAKRNVSEKHHGKRYVGTKILNNRLGVIRDKYVLGDKPYLEKRQDTHTFERQATLPLTKQIERRVESLEHVADAHVMTDGDLIVIGVESNESDRKKLIQSIQKEIEDIVNPTSVSITTNRRILNRMKAIEHHVHVPSPFKSQGGTIGEFVDLVDDTVSGRK
ncbi:sporulation lipoprotein YhcN/YlaJ [Halalkalibacter nanhaiisediminis]|uniref:Sporulation lipoprotein YhcN/YlaJ n=2 Tax=Halalkalibacter nanhaiisediminis TaxID=688079 RepID=A0A562QQB3_9BACI|nr:sporulation lipoprotein YhcN/YlaJ [Halalkalibacter nanhaiisediminis]